jgi:beta-lactamase class D
MKKLVQEKLPFEEKHQKTVNGLGWYIGFVETKKGTWVFAVNFNGGGKEAKNFAIETLKQEKMIK